MASLADIPDKFDSKETKVEFILWVADLPIIPTFRRNLAYQWSVLTGAEFSAKEWEHIITGIRSDRNGS